MPYHTLRARVLRRVRTIEQPRTDSGLVDQISACIDRTLEETYLLDSTRKNALDVFRGLLIHNYHLYESKRHISHSGAIEQYHFVECDKIRSMYLFLDKLNDDLIEAQPKPSLPRRFFRWLFA